MTGNVLVKRWTSAMEGEREQIQEVLLLQVNVLVLGEELKDLTQFPHLVSPYLETLEEEVGT